MSIWIFIRFFFWFNLEKYRGFFQGVYWGFFRGLLGFFQGVYWGFFSFFCGGQGQGQVPRGTDGEMMGRVFHGRRGTRPYLYFVLLIEL